MPFTRLSSRLTVVYKLFIPLIGLAGLLGYGWLIVAQQWPLELHGVVLLSFLFLLLLFTVIISIRIRHVAYNESFIQIRNYGKPIVIPSTTYRLLTPAEFPFNALYQLRTSTSNFLFLSSFSGTLKKAFELEARVGSILEPDKVIVARKVLTAKSLPTPFQ